MSFDVFFQKQFAQDIDKHKKAGQKKLLSKINGFVSEIRKDPRSGTGNPEQLKYMDEETWSRRINKQHRLTYEITDNNVYLLSAWGNY